MRKEHQRFVTIVLICIPNPEEHSLSLHIMIPHFVCTCRQTNRFLNKCVYLGCSWNFTQSVNQLTLIIQDVNEVSITVAFQLFALVEFS